MTTNNYVYIPVSDWPSTKQRKNGVLVERVSGLRIHLRIQQGAASASIELDWDEAVTLLNTLQTLTKEITTK